MLVDEARWEIEGDQVILTASADPFVGNFDCFTEWASEADCKAFDQISTTPGLRRNDG